MIAEPNEYFRRFVGSMDTMLRTIEREDGRNQQAMMEHLFSLEDRFRRMLVSTQKGRDMYRRFMKFITEEKGNILHTRIYFRERQESFDKISIAFKRDKPELLQRLRINYVFCDWIMKRYPGNPRPAMRKTFKEIIATRQLVCTAALPSAIHEAKKFYYKILSTHLDYMDMVQNATEGLMNAIDKFEPPFGEVFGSVVVGRMKERIMDDHNSTLVKIPSKDKRILYRANSARNKRKLSSDEDIEKYVCQSFKGVTKEEIGQITSAANSLVSFDAPLNQSHDSSGQRTLQEVIPDQQESQETQLVNKDLTTKLNRGIMKLTILEKKVTILKNGPMGT